MDGQKVNPENKCAGLYREFPCQGCRLKKMYAMQNALQKRMFDSDPGKWDFLDSVRYVKDQWNSLTMEYAEMMERLPYKHWRDYSDEEKGWKSEEERLEVLFEYVDMFHFYLNMGIGLGFAPEEIFSAYMSKNDENFRRQEDGYGKGEKSNGEERRKRL